MEHAMKVVERIFEHRIQQQIEVDDVHFGFMKGKGTTDAIFSKREREFTFATFTFAICCLSSVTLVHPTQAVEIFDSISTAFGTLVIC